MYKIIALAFIALNAPHFVNASKEVKCICNNRAIKSPDCGICGSLAGTMEQTETGADCMCTGPTKPIKSHEASCADACKGDGGWSGEFGS